MKKFNDKIQELLNSVLKKSSPNEENIDVEDISDDAYIDDVFAENVAYGPFDPCADNPAACKGLGA